jgi:serine O-acetyltransferase
MLVLGAQQARRVGTGLALTGKNIEPMQPDWSRERKRLFEWAPSKSLLAALRSWHRHREARGFFGQLGRFIAKRRVQLWSVITGADIPVFTTLGGGLFLPHPNGIVMHRDVVIGANCMIMQQVTIGQLAEGGVPRLGNGVYVGAGAKIIGPVTIGDGAAIGANAVVLSDVPAHSTAVGIPARIVRQR